MSALDRSDAESLTLITHAQAGRDVDAEIEADGTEQEARAILDPARWGRLTEARSAEAFAAGWLDLQCDLVGSTLRALVVIGPPEQGPFAPLAFWPDGSEGSPELAAIAEVAMEERRITAKPWKPSTGVDPASDDEKRGDAIAVPLLVDDQLCGVAAMEVTSRPPAQLRAAMRRLQWGMAWLEVLVRRRTFASKERLVAVLDLLAAALEHEGFKSSATAVATELATTLGCDRVSIGFSKKRHVKVEALSHSAEFGKKTNLIRALGAAMDEAGDQDVPLVYPAPDEGSPRVLQAHEALAQQQGSGAICTVPISERGELIGGLTLERREERPFDAREVELCEHLAVLLGPILETKRKEDRWLFQKAGSSAAKFVRQLFGARHTALKLTVIAITSVVVFLSFAEGTYRVTADAVLEGTIQRTITAPIAGYIASAGVRAGDVVQAGQQLAALKDDELRLERLRWESQKQQREREYSRALATNDRAQVRILGAQVDQAAAQIQLLDQQLARIRITAPFDGILVSGDLSQSLNAPVERGEVLFELAPLDGYRVILRVDERDVGEVAVGQQGELALEGLAGQTLPLVIDKITPVATAEEGRNFFRIEADLTEPSTALRPGMQGVGKVEIDTRKIFWIYTHKLAYALRMSFWSWLP